MSLVRRRRAALLGAVSSAAAVVLASPVGADPSGRGDSAAAVIDQYRQEGYAVQVNGSPAGDTSLLTTCTVTSVDKPAGPTPDPASTTINVVVAGPLNHA